MILATLLLNAHTTFNPSHYLDSATQFVLNLLEEQGIPDGPFPDNACFNSLQLTADRVVEYVLEKK